MSGCLAALGSGGGARHPTVGQFLSKPAVAIASGSSVHLPPLVPSASSAVAPEDGLDQVAKVSVGNLPRGGGRRVVEAAAGLAEHGADLADTAAGFLRDELDHRAAPGWGLVPKMTAAFFKMSFSNLRLAISRRNLGTSSAPGGSPPARNPPLPRCPGCEPLRIHP